MLNITRLRSVLCLFLLGVALHAAAQDTPAFERSSLYVPVRDGTRLAMNVYRPVRNGQVIDAPLPVIFVFTPYRARYRNADGDIVELTQGNMGIHELLASGYVIAQADVRGKGASFGARRGFQDRTEANDGYDLVQWLAGQPWSNGIVGMVGCSYVGGTTVHVASTQPPALKAIFTGATDLDKFDFVRRGGITAQFNTRPDEPLSDDLMSVPVDADTDGSLLREAVAQHAGNTPMAPLWYGMPFRDSYSPLTDSRFWEEVGPYPYLDAIKASGIATYVWSNLQDEPTSQVILLAQNLGSRLLVGPGSHCQPPPDFDLGGEVLSFMDYHLKGIDNGFADKPRTTLWVENAPEGQHWKRGDFLPGDEATTQPWYFSDRNTQPDDPANNGGLLAKPAASASQSFTVNYAVGAGEYFSFWAEPQDANGLTYSTAALAQDVHLEGYPVAHLALAADREDVNVFVYLEEVDAAGQVTMLSMGRLAASYRALSEPPYDMLGLPYHSGHEADHQPLVPGETVSMAIALMPVSRIIPAGHRLRMTVAGADARQRNLADIRETPAPVLTLQLGGEQGSRIHLPVLE
ncbi:MAG: CocE/NonD family hydrolase [Pseudohongiellaceae bacterium]